MWLSGSVENQREHEQYPLTQQNQMYRNSEAMYSMQGNCSEAPPQSLLNRLGGLVSLRPLRAQQCIIVTDMDLLRVQYGPLWLDNLYVRLRRSSRDERPQLIEAEFDGKAYLTRVTIQGDGDTTKPCQAAKASASMLIQGALHHIFLL